MKPVIKAYWMTEPRGRRQTWMLLLVLLWGAFWQCAAAAQAPLHFDTAQILELEGYGFTAPPYEVRETELTGHWQTVTLPHALMRKLVSEEMQGEAQQRATVVTWYRLQVPEGSVSNSPNYIYIPRWKTDGQIAVYGDHRLLYQSHADVFWNGWNIPLWISLDETADAVRPRVILIRVERPRDSGGGISTVWLGENDRLSWRYHMRYLLQVQLPYISSVAFLIAGLFALVVWFRRREDALYVLFFWVSLASFLRTLHYHVGKNRLMMPDEWFSWLTIDSLFWMIAVVHLFLNHLHRQPVLNLNRAVLGLTVLMSIITLPLFPDVPSVYLLSPLIYIFLMIMGTTVGLVGGVLSWRVRSRDGLLLSAWCLMGMFFWFYDWLLQSNHIDIEGIYLGPYTNFVAFLLFLYIMFHRYVGAMDEVKRVNASLAQRLQAREAELQQSYSSQREAAHRQTLVEERQRMMQDMHDGMGSSLRTALLAIEKGQMDATLVADVLKGCIDDLKLAIDAMEPVQADLLLLLATLRFRLGPRLESAGIALRWEVTNVPALDWLDPRNSLHILRIFQEAFTNIVKHTHATEIRVATRVEANQVVVTITDNGPGFDVAQALHSGGKGLGNQLRRAESIGAEIGWSRTASGSCVSLRLPIKRETDGSSSSVG
ncbi:MAG: integral membrane sensor signal transduction histidine kinase [Comamonadaceae bacterium]|nr:MAG: integral membrane sensor signal transduction histidine kinase [Comamonadaceae bacterium]